MPNTPQHDLTGALAAFGLIAGPRFGEEIPVRSPVVTIGQGAQNDIVLADDSVSKTHARLEYENGSWRLTDLESTNGTLVEGVRLAPHVPTPLAYGYTVRFGGVQTQFREVDAADPEAARASYSAPMPAQPVASRRRFRLPVWLFLLILIVLGALAFFVMDGPDPRPATPAPEAVSVLLVSGALPGAP